MWDFILMACVIGRISVFDTLACGLCALKHHCSLDFPFRDTYVGIAFCAGGWLACSSRKGLSVGVVGTFLDHLLTLA